MSIEAMKQALEALEESHPEAYRHVITSLRQAIAGADRVASIDTSKDRVDETAKQRHEQEPVRIMGFNCVCGRRMEVSAEQGVVPAPQRQPLTDEMTKQMRESCDSMEMRGAFVDGWTSAEAAHGIKGEA